MRLFVGVTDNNWFKFLSRLASASGAGLDEVNFWLPSPESFHALAPGELFLFKLHRTAETGYQDLIAGGGIFVSYSILPLSLAWQAFGEKNGAPSLPELRTRISAYRRQSPLTHEDFKIGCLILTQPFFLDRESWFEIPGWSAPIVRGKGYSTEDEVGRYLWRKITELWARKNMEELSKEAKRIEEERARYGRETIIRPRLGQGAFRVVVTDAYRRMCAITTEKALPALEAAHIKPFSESGPHAIYNGLLLRSDLHRLLDAGYLTITPDYFVEISPRLKEDFENGQSYYKHHGQKLVNLPPDPRDWPDPQFLTWHNENIFKG